MVERKLYKTKLCMLYQRGRCSRQYCNFAHGSAELRRSFNGRESNRGGSDLRERLDRMRSPSRSSMERGDANARHSYRGDSPHSDGKRIAARRIVPTPGMNFNRERNHRKRKQLDGHSDHSGRVSDGNDDHIKVRRQSSSSDARMRVSEQLREMQSQIKRVQNDKRELEIYLEDRAKEADTLSMKIHELEMQLSKEKEESKKFTTKIKKFIKVLNRHARLQDDVKRSHAQLQKLGEQLNLEDDPKINTFNDEMTGGYAINPSNEGQMNSSPPRRRARVFLDTYDASDQVGERMETGKYRVEKLSRQPMDHGELSNGRIPESDFDEYNVDGSVAYEDKSNRVNQTHDFASAGKVSETGVTLPSTGIAAHAVDDVEVIEADDALPANGANIAEAETEASLKIPNLPFLPPPPPSIPQDVYSQYKGEDESVDIDGIDEELVEVDIV